MNATEYLKKNKHLRNNNFSDKDLIIILDGFLQEKRTNSKDYDNREVAIISKSLENFLLINEGKINGLVKSHEKETDGKKRFFISKVIKRQEKIVFDIEQLILKTSEK